MWSFKPSGAHCEVFVAAMIKKSRFCCQKVRIYFLPQRDLDGSYHAAGIIFSAAIYECLFWVFVDWLRFHVRKERGHFQLSDERIHQNNLWSKSSIAYQIQLRFKNIFISDMTLIVTALRKTIIWNELENLTPKVLNP